MKTMAIINSAQAAAISSALKVLDGESENLAEEFGDIENLTFVFMEGYWRAVINDEEVG